MTIKKAEILNIVRLLAEDEQVRVTVTESVKGGLITGATATAGGILFGPVGVAAGV